MSDLIARAKSYAAHAHRGQFDKSGHDYFIAHVQPVAQHVRELGGTEEQVAAAYLHDVVEDTQVTREAISLAFGPQIAVSVHTLTREKYGHTYAEYIERIASDPEVVIIKIADIMNNLKPERLVNLPRDKRGDLVKRYGRALERLWLALD